MPTIQGLVPCLWFDGTAEQAANFYCAIFPNAKIADVSRYMEAGKEIHGQEPGTAMAVNFELDGHPFMGLNGGPMFKFTEAVSFQVMCADQTAIDHYWTKLSAGGDENAQQCGWLKDQFGLSWQVVPVQLADLLRGPNGNRVMQALLQMKKLDLATLQQAAQG